MTASPTIVRIRAHEIAIVGNDMMLAALPARPVQLAHAVRACGFDLVVPVSWGEELIAGQALAALRSAGDRPVVFCACPRVRTRLLHAGPELAPRLFSCVPPPVAAARYLRALQPDATIRITYLGACEGAKDPSIDARVSPADFLRHLEASGVSLLRQSSVFDSIVPPDRRRYLSTPGGLPTAERVAQSSASYRLVSADASDLAADIADRLIADEPVLLDVALPLGCSCAGADYTEKGQSPREMIASLEPPRATAPVVDSDVPILLAAPTLPPPETRAHEPQAQVQAETIPPIVPGVRSIEEARRRAERRRIAVTPANVRPSSVVEDSEAGRSSSLAWADPPSQLSVGLPEPSHATDATGSTEQESPPPVPVPQRPVPESDNVRLASVPLAEGTGDAETTIDLGGEAGQPPAEPTTGGEPTGKPTTPAVVAASAGAATGDARIPTPGRAWQVARIATPPRARLGAGFVPRAYASRRPRASAEVEDSAEVAESKLEGEAPPPMPAEVAPAEWSEPLAAPDAASAVSRPPTLPMPGPAHINEYVTIKQRMAQRRLNSRPRAVPPVEEARGERLWRLLAYVLLILALAIATLAIVRR
jgi:hypothetical protein